MSCQSHLKVKRFCQICFSLEVVKRLVQCKLATVIFELLLLWWMDLTGRHESKVTCCVYLRQQKANICHTKHQIQIGFTSTLNTLDLDSWYQKWHMQHVLLRLTHICLASHFMDLGEQCRPSDVWSGSPLFANAAASDQGLHCLLSPRRLIRVSTVCLRHVVWSVSPLFAYISFFNIKIKWKSTPCTPKIGTGVIQ